MAACQCTTSCPGNAHSCNWKGDANNFSDSRGMIHFEFIRRTINAAAFRHLLKVPGSTPQQMTQGKSESTHLPAHGQCPIHKANICKDFLRDTQVQLVPHPPYSLDLAHNDYWFYLWEEAFEETNICNKGRPQVYCNGGNWSHLFTSVHRRNLQGMAEDAWQQTAVYLEGQSGDPPP